MSFLKEEALIYPESIVAGRAKRVVVAKVF